MIGSGHFPPDTWGDAMPPDESTPARPGMSDRVWAVLGLVAALILAGISLDLLIGQAAPPVTGAGGDDDCGC
jgi:hypothetical protein